MIYTLYTIKKREVFRMKKLFALLAVVAMICAFCTGCGNKIVSENVKVSFIVTVDKDGNELDAEEVIGGPITVDVEGSESNPPTVLKAAQLALAELEYENGYGTTSDGQSISNVNGYENHEETDAETGYYTYWDAYVNGSRSDSGRQGVTQVYTNDEVVFKFIHSSTPREDINQSYVDDAGAQD